jgi:hypothetical protein
MFAPLIPIQIISIYEVKKGVPADLPTRMAKCTVDMHKAVMGLAAALKDTGNALVLSDLFRSYEMQKQANLDFVEHRKKAFSPPPGGSMHEAGRALDLDLGKIKKMGLKAFWGEAAKHGLSPIIDKPDPETKESWHFDCRGSHQKVYDYYDAGRAKNFKAPYTAMAASAIVSTGQKVDALGEDPKPGYIQSALIRLGQDIGALDGNLGQKSKDALTAIGIDPAKPLDQIVAEIGVKLRAAFPGEYLPA